ncbi:MAG: GDSL-type esterase/lipase family protein [Lachnospirales bacterium]
MEWNSSFYVCHMKMFKFNNMENRTIRLNLPNNLQGDKVRLLFSNELGQSKAYVKNILLNNAKVTFNGKEELEIPVGEEIYSDPLDFTYSDNIQITYFLPKQKIIYSGNNTGSFSEHSKRGVKEQNFVSTTGLSFLFDVDHFSINSPIPLFKAVEIYGEARVISCFGDSITAGCQWFDCLQRNIYSDFHNISMGNAGISGNRMNSDSPAKFRGHLGKSGISRFEKDVLEIKGVSHCIISIGTNDIGFPNTIWSNEKIIPKPKELIKSYKILTDKCKAQNIKTIGIGILPRDDKDFSPEKNEIRLQVNEELYNSGFFDLALNCDKVFGADKVNRDYYSKDILHLSKAGGEALGQYIYENIKFMF